ncbi:hypothetical protein [Ectobacillus ponti]|uniref:Uncharacterized protein n=1 Tax=Ectobacillus ponti TaxID=2961894 RepID=A0AA42BRS6_9BACI|nr:hypothetical protein [Ectobacillus ponti]MCP8967663.1 hypothetical protein [Ectobacillus ponti]
MWRNQGTALLLHAVIGMLIWFGAGAAMELLIRLRIAADGLSDYIFLFFCLVGLLFYYWAGKRYLRKLSTKQENLLSVSLVSIIGILLWGSCYFFTDGGFAWVPYMLYNAALYPLITLFPADGEAFFVIVAFLPSLVFWLALQRQERRT